MYLCQPKRNNIRIIAGKSFCSPSCIAFQLLIPREDQIKSAQSSSASPTQHIYHFLPTPRLTALGTQILTDFGIIGDLHIQAIGIGAEWIVLEDDLLSLEKDDSVAREIGLVSYGSRRFANVSPRTWFNRMATTRPYLILRRLS